MATKTTVVLVGTSPTRLDIQPDNTTAAPQVCTYYNAGTVDVWLGDASVTVGGGIKLAAGGTASETIPVTEKRYGIASQSCQVNVDQVGV